MCDRIFAPFRAVEAARNQLQWVVTVRGVNLSLRIVWRRAANFAKQCGFSVERKACDVARCVEFDIFPLHWLRPGRGACQRISGIGAAPGGLWLAAAGRGAE